MPCSVERTTTFMINTSTEKRCAKEASCSQINPIDIDMYYVDMFEYLP